MTAENVTQEVRLTNIDEIKKLFIEEINQNVLMSKKHKNVCKVLNYIKHLLILISTVTGWISISAFASLVDIPVGISSYAVVLKICVIAGIKKQKSIIKKKEKKLDKTVLLAKSKLSSIEALSSKALIDSNISHDEFVSINNALKEYNDMKD